MTNTRSLLIGALLCLTVLVVFYPSLDGLFVWDSRLYVFNYSVLWLITPENLSTILFKAFGYHWQPLVYLTHMLDFHFYANRPWGHHLTNLLLHMGNCLLVYHVSRRILQTHSIDWDQAKTAAWFIAFIFAVHPQQVEVVAWVIARKDLMATLFSLLAIASHLNYRDSGNHWFRWLTILLVTAALFCKSSAVVMFAVLTVIDVYPLRHFPPSIRGLIHSLKDKTSILFITLGVVIVTIVTKVDTISSTSTIPLELRLPIVIHNIGFYVFKLLSPIDLSPFYPVQNEFKIRAPQFWLPGLALSVIWFATAWTLARKKRYELLTAGLLYLLMIAPMSGFLHFGAALAADRFAYMAKLPLLMIIVPATIFYCRAWLPSTRRLIPIVMGSIILIWSFQSNQLSRVWINSLNLWSYVIAIYPDSNYANHNLAVAWYDQGNYEKAVEYELKARKLGFKDANGDIFFNLIQDELKRINQQKQTLQKEDSS